MQQWRLVLSVLVLAVCGSLAVAEALQIRLQWDYPSGTTVTTFRIYRQISPDCSGTWVNYGEVPEAERTFADSAILMAQTYCYRVTALDALGQESPPSNAVSFSVPFAPGAPTNLRGTILP